MMLLKIDLIDRYHGETLLLVGYRQWWRWRWRGWWRGEWQWCVMLDGRRTGGVW